MLRRSFKSDCDTDSSSTDYCSMLTPYRPGFGVNIDGQHAIQIINQ